MMEIIRSQPEHDVIVIGSGASGGMAAYNLTQKGVNVLMLDAGDHFQRSDFWTHVLPFEWHARERDGEKPLNFFLDKREQPYLTPPGKPYDLVRVWGIGGKTHAWGRVSLRLSDINLKEPEVDGWGIPWPISYRDLGPYYDRVEQLIGICGGDDDLDILPGSRYHMPVPAPRCGEVILRNAARSMEIPVVPIRRANITREHRGFPPCHYCGACGRGCDTASFFTSSDYLIPFAEETGRLKLIPNAVAARVLVDDSGKASGVQYFHRHTGQEERVYGRVVVVAASAMDSTRILLNSKSDRHPNGLGNGSDQLGRNFCEQQMVHVMGFLPQLLGADVRDEDGLGGEHVYIPRFNHRVHRGDYLRGFGIQMWGSGAQMDPMSVANSVPGFGSAYKRKVRERYPAQFWLHPFGEVLPRPENRVTVDESQTDRYGVPLMKISVEFGENERKMRHHMYEIAEELFHTMGAEIVPFNRDAHDPPGSSIHEHGICRMGSDPKLSVLNQFNQMHEVDNVFVVDGSAFPSASEKNPTFTIMALAWRATDYLAEKMRQGNL